ncbi:MAG TPA: hypothetical protein VIL85_01590 [Thermomicrobiales bacterium]|jgi:hypothetical protein
MTRWRTTLPGLLLLGLVACGGAPAATVSQPLGAATAAAAPSAAPTTTPRAVAATTATAAAPGSPATPGSAGIPTRVPGAPAAQQPGGPVPAGWQVYRGPREFPIVIAYPPDWTADDSYFPAQYVLFLYGPAKNVDEEESVEITAGPEDPGANIDVLRDDFFYRKTPFCDKTGIEYTTQRQLTGAAFAILGATCDQSNELAFFQVASGLKGGDGWNIAMRTPYARRDQRLREVFDPMLASLNIYAPFER